MYKSIFSDCHTIHPSHVEMKELRITHHRIGWFPRLQSDIALLTDSNWLHDSQSIDLWFVLATSGDNKYTILTGCVHVRSMNVTYLWQKIRPQSRQWCLLSVRENVTLHAAQFRATSSRTQWFARLPEDRREQTYNAYGTCRHGNNNMYNSTITCTTRLPARKSV